MKVFDRALILAVLFVSIAGEAIAHVTLERQEAAPGSYYKAVLAVPHGCGGAATTAISIDIPEGIIAVKPSPKPGWQLATDRGAYSTTYAHHGREVREGVRRVTWSGGSLADEHYDEFVFQAYIAAELKPGALIHFPVTQLCAGEKKLIWNEPPSQESGGKPSAYPAPVVRLVPRQGEKPQ